MEETLAGRHRKEPVTGESDHLRKVAEFRRLGYPDLVLQKTLSYLGATTGDGTWIRVRNALRDASDTPQEGAEAS